MKLVFFTLSIFIFENYIASAVEQISKNDEIEGDNIELFNKCYDELGCVETDSRWYDKNLRPVNLRPMERHIIKTDFLLLKNNKSGSESLLYNSMAAKSNSIKAAGFNKKGNTYILIHDFTGNGYTGWIKHLAKVLLRKSSGANVVSVDWQRGAEPPYDLAISNGRVVALEIILLLKELKEKFEMDFCKIHIVGHGVGAHIAGYVGTVYNSIKKITGLDPSGPRFEGLPDIVKLNPSNARYVEVIHTDSFNDISQGTKEAMGHSDFYINDAFQQPGCVVNTTVSDVLSVERNSIIEGEVLPGCSHKRAFKYFIESMRNGTCIFLGMKCSSYEDFANGKCVSCGKSDALCRTFGAKTYRSSVEKSTFYLNTAEHYPYCLYLYKVTISVSQAEGDYYGYFDFILVDGNANIAVASLSDSRSSYRDYKSGSNNTYIYYAPAPKIETIKEAKVRWNEKKKFYCLVYCKQSIHVEGISFKFLGTGRDDEGVEENLCSADHESEIENGSYKMFVNCKVGSSSSASSSTSKTKFSSMKLSTSTEISTSEETSTSEEISTSNEAYTSTEISTSGGLSTASKTFTSTETATSAETSISTEITTST